MMSALNSIRPIPNIEGIVHDISAKCKEGHFGHTPGSTPGIDSDDMDVRCLVNVIQEVTRVRGSNLFLFYCTNNREPGKVPQSFIGRGRCNESLCNRNSAVYVMFCIKPYDEGAAEWKDGGARCIEIGN